MKKAPPFDDNTNRKYTKDMVSKKWKVIMLFSYKKLSLLTLIIGGNLFATISEVVPPSIIEDTKTAHERLGLHDKKYHLPLETTPHISENIPVTVTGNTLHVNNKTLLSMPYGARVATLATEISRFQHNDNRRINTVFLATTFTAALIANTFFRKQGFCLLRNHRVKRIRDASFLGILGGTIASNLFTFKSTHRSEREAVTALKCEQCTQEYIQHRTTTLEAHKKGKNNPMLKYLRSPKNLTTFAQQQKGLVCQHHATH